jgi:hypothetical protein
MFTILTNVDVMKKEIRFFASLTVMNLGTLEFKDENKIPKARVTQSACQLLRSFANSSQ